jgi:hypothetical protein
MQLKKGRSAAGSHEYGTIYALKSVVITYLLGRCGIISLNTHIGWRYLRMKDDMSN